MERYLLDTSAILDVLEGNAQGRRVREIVGNSESVTSVICYCEVLNKSNEVKIAKAESFLSQLMIFGAARGEGEIARDFQYACRKSGKTIRSMDALIAATAFTNNAILLSSDSDFERIDGIRKIIL